MVSIKGFTVWFTGLPFSGKTTISQNLEYKLKLEEFEVEIIDGDTFRKTISKDLGFSKEDRDKNIERAVYIASMLNKHGVIVLASFISPYRTMREWARKYINNFIEVYVKCPIEICEKRDTKGFYKKAREGIIPNFTGISDVYEEPFNPDLVLKTDTCSVEDSTLKVFQLLKKYIGDK